MSWHKSVGLMVLLLALLRIAWRWRKGFIQPLTKTPVWQRKIALSVHVFLLMATVFMPLSGVMMTLGKVHPLLVFGVEMLPAITANESLKDLGRIVHGLGKDFLIIALLLHVLASFQHAFVHKDGSLRRMLGKL